MAFSLVTTCIACDSFAIIRPFSVTSVGLELRSLKHKFIVSKIGDADLKSLQNYLTKTKCQEMLDRQKWGEQDGFVQSI